MQLTVQQFSVLKYALDSLAGTEQFLTYFIVKDEKSEKGDSRLTNQRTKTVRIADVTDIRTQCLRIQI
jgi:hypothetical protein